MEFEENLKLLDIRIVSKYESFVIWSSVKCWLRNDEFTINEIIDWLFTNNKSVYS
jgi:hypothetical protein